MSAFDDQNPSRSELSHGNDDSNHEALSSSSSYPLSFPPIVSDTIPNRFDRWCATMTWGSGLGGSGVGTGTTTHTPSSGTTGTAEKEAKEVEEQEKRKGDVRDVEDADGDDVIIPLMLAAEDVKFASNAWNLLRLGCFFGVGGGSEVTVSAAAAGVAVDVASSSSMTSCVDDCYHDPNSAIPSTTTATTEKKKGEAEVSVSSSRVIAQPPLLILSDLKSTTPSMMVDEAGGENRSSAAAGTSAVTSAVDLGTQSSSNNVNNNNWIFHHYARLSTSACTDAGGEEGGRRKKEGHHVNTGEENGKTNKHRKVSLTEGEEESISPFIQGRYAIYDHFGLPYRPRHCPRRHDSPAISRSSNDRKQTNNKNNTHTRTRQPPHHWVTVGLTTREAEKLFWCTGGVDGGGNSDAIEKVLDTDVDDVQTNDVNDGVNQTPSTAEAQRSLNNKYMRATDYNIHHQHTHASPEHQQTTDTDQQLGRSRSSQQGVTTAQRSLHDNNKKEENSSTPSLKDFGTLHTTHTETHTVIHAFDWRKAINALRCRVRFEEEAADIRKRRTQNNSDRELPGGEDDTMNAETDDDTISVGVLLIVGQENGMSMELSHGGVSIVSPSPDSPAKLSGELRHEETTRWNGCGKKKAVLSGGPSLLLAAEAASTANKRYHHHRYLYIDHCVVIPQCGSVGSLSMTSALAIAAHTVYRSLSSSAFSSSASSSLHPLDCDLLRLDRGNHQVSFKTSSRDSGRFVTTTDGVEVGVGVEIRDADSGERDVDNDLVSVSVPESAQKVFVQATTTQAVPLTATPTQIPTPASNAFFRQQQQQQQQKQQLQMTGHEEEPAQTNEAAALPQSDLPGNKHERTVPPSLPPPDYAAVVRHALAIQRRTSPIQLALLWCHYYGYCDHHHHHHHNTKEEEQEGEKDDRNNTTTTKKGRHHNHHVMHNHHHQQYIKIGKKDRNLSACVRNGNAFNVERVIVLNNKRYYKGKGKFNKRGSIGCDRYTEILHIVHNHHEHSKMDAGAKKRSNIKSYNSNTISNSNNSNRGGGSVKNTKTSTAGSIITSTGTTSTTAERLVQSRGSISKDLDSFLTSATTKDGASCMKRGREAAGPASLAAPAATTASSPTPVEAGAAVGDVENDDDNHDAYDSDSSPQHEDDYVLWGVVQHHPYLGPACVEEDEDDDDGIDVGHQNAADADDIDIRYSNKYLSLCDTLAIRDAMIEDCCVHDRRRNKKYTADGRTGEGGFQSQNQSDRGTSVHNHGGNVQQQQHNRAACRGKNRALLLAIPEEGRPLPPPVLSRCHRLLYLLNDNNHNPRPHTCPNSNLNLNPNLSARADTLYTGSNGERHNAVNTSSLAHQPQDGVSSSASRSAADDGLTPSSQRGLPGAMIAAVCLERLRFVIERFI